MQAHLPALQANENGSQTESGSRLQIDGADGGTRTRTDLSIQRILSPLRLPFRHIGERQQASVPRSAFLQAQNGYLQKQSEVSVTVPATSPRLVWPPVSALAPYDRI